MRTSHLALPASQCEQFRKAFVSQTRASQRLCRAATGASFLPSRYAAIKSIDVEFAHFVNKGQITTAAAEVCLLAEDGSVLLNSYICPGNLYESFRSIKVAPVCSMACPSAELHAASSGFDWIGGVTVENYTDAPTLKVIQQQLTTLLEGATCVCVRWRIEMMQSTTFYPYLLINRQFADRIRSKQGPELIASASSPCIAEGSDQIQKVPVQHWSGS